MNGNRDFNVSMSFNGSGSRSSIVSENMNLNEKGMEEWEYECLRVREIKRDTDVSFYVLIRL